jgi:hypothetical protein
MTTTQRMIEAGRIERRHQRVSARRNGISGMGGPVKAESHAWRQACGRAYRIVSNGPGITRRELESLAGEAYRLFR